MGRVDVKAPEEPADIKYIYDFSSIFATPEQESKFVDPYSGARGETQPKKPDDVGLGFGPKFASGGLVDGVDLSPDNGLVNDALTILFADASLNDEAGHVDDITDKLLRLLGDD